MLDNVYFLSCFIDFDSTCTAPLYRVCVRWGSKAPSPLNAGSHTSECYGVLREGFGSKKLKICITYFLNGPVIENSDDLHEITVPSSTVLSKAALLSCARVTCDIYAKFVLLLLSNVEVQK